MNYLSFFLFLSFAQAQDYIVTAERVPSLIKETSSRITKYDLSSENSLKENFEGTTGTFFSQSGEFGGNTSFSIRGLGRGQTRIRFDGIDLEDASDIDNDFQFQQLSTGLVGSAELTRGIQSGLYGADALGGVFLLAPDDNGSNLEFKLGSYSQRAVNAKYNSNEGTTIILDYFSTDGISAFNENKIEGPAERDSFKRLNSYLKQRWQVNQKLEIEFKALFLMSSSEIDGGFPLADLVDNDLSEFNQSIYAIGLKYYPLEDDRHQLHFNLSKNDVTRTIQGVKYQGETQRAEIDYTYIPSSLLTLRLNSEFKGQEAIVENNFGKKEEELLAVGLSTHFKKGIIFGHQSFRMDYHSKFEDVWSTQTGLGIKLNSYTNIKMNYSIGFKSPTLYQLYAPLNNGTSNPNLRPTRARGGDVGILFLTDNFSFETTYFKTELLRQIDFDNGYYNIAKSEFQGVEQNVKVILNKFSFGVDYTYLEAKDLKNNRRISNRPKNQWGAELSYAPVESLSLGLRSFFKGSRHDFVGRLPSYGRQDLYINYKLNQNNQLSLKIGNILNRDYEDVRDYGTMGRNFLTSWRKNF